MAHETQVGKEIIGMLMFSMYPEPCTIFREYIQNAYDSIRLAVDGDADGKTLLASLDDGIIYINTDKSTKTITIKDNGVGIPMAQAEQRLKDIGKSIKRYLRSLQKQQAGWFGVGRLVGAGYCRKLIFRTTAFGENFATELSFDVDAIRNILYDDLVDMEAGKVIDTTTTFRDDINASADEHWFEVVLCDILPDYSSLLDHKTIKNYVTQVAPLAYDMMFKRLIKKAGEETKKRFETADYIRINLNDDTDLKKAYSDIIEGTSDSIEGISSFEIKEKDTVYAWGWYGLTRFTKAIESTEASDLTRGFRLRCQNILVGDLNYFGGKQYFSEARGNEYFNGEVHIVDPRISPTSDRSDLEPSPESLKLKELLKEFFSKKLQPVYKNASTAKKAIEHYTEAIAKIEEVKEQETSSTFTQEVKDEKIKEYNEIKDKANSDFTTLLNRKGKEETPEGVKQVIELYIKAAQDDNVGIVSEPSPTTPKKKKKEEQQEDTLATKIESLSTRYSSKQISFLKKCFKLMDKFYAKSNPDLIKSIQYSIVNGLLN